MFTKNTEKLESLIGANSAFKGNIETKGTLRVDGSMEGNVNADWLILGEKGSIKGDITARGIVVGGRIDGNLRAKEIVEIKSKGQIFGDVSSVKFTIIEGGIFEGRSSMSKEEIKVIEFQAKSSL